MVIEELGHRLVESLCHIALEVFFNGEAYEDLEELETDELTVRVHTSLVSAATGHSRDKDQVNICML